MEPEQLKRLRGDLEKQFSALEKHLDSAKDFVELERALEEMRVRALGRKGEITQLLRLIGEAPPPERGQLGKDLNALKEWAAGEIQRISSLIEGAKKASSLTRLSADISLPGRTQKLGAEHPITKVFREVESIFVRLGFDVADGPEIESDYYNFEALNIPKHHPARDLQDTLYITDELLLRTHTSPVQIHVMEKHNPPLRVIAPGTVYRRDDDVSHSAMFHQVEGLFVDEEVSMADLKGVLAFFAQEIFGIKTKIRFRPHYFPFTEPSAEVDVRCMICKGEGCRVCGRSGWIEILGCGMVHPNVFQAVGYDPKYRGFAFGFGIDRIAMILYGIDDIRLFYSGDLRFNRQF